MYGAWRLLWGALDLRPTDCCLNRSPGNQRLIVQSSQLSVSSTSPLTAAHWGMSALLALALVIDIMKPASLGFVTPGMRTEYHLDAGTVAWLPFAALFGTVVGSFLWGALADIYGRRASILFSSVMFIGTSICGAMPDFWWNVGMCFLMGAAAGGMLPVAYALLAEIMPARHRGWSLVLIGGIGSVGGYFVASGLSALLQPMFGWRIMWFLNFPTGLLLVLLSPLLPESARFLQHRGRSAEARMMFARFGMTFHEGKASRRYFNHHERSFASAAGRSAVHRNQHGTHAGSTRVGIGEFRFTAGSPSRWWLRKKCCCLQRLWQFPPHWQHPLHRHCLVALQCLEHQVVANHHDWRYRIGFAGLGA